MNEGYSQIHLTREQAESVGKRIWQNECAGTVEGLASWNRGEAFASLGIGHFIWYPKGATGPFEESFPALIRYLRSTGVRIPPVLEQPGCPWSDRSSFLAASDSPEMREIRAFLLHTVPQQTAFIVQRLEASLPKMLKATHQKKKIQTQFYRLAETPQGLYALIDYVNFKGEGVAVSERYEGKGWGLLQVLEGMNPQAPSAPKEFARSANVVLTERVHNAPAARGEKRWLEGWRNRLKTY